MNIAYYRGSLPRTGFERRRAAAMAGLFRRVSDG
jgi:hypothetical protein